MSTSTLSILMAGGGTGGHLWPGIALAEAVLSLAPHSKITFLVPGKPIDKNILVTTDFEWHCNPMRPRPASLQHGMQFLRSFAHGWLKTLRLLRACRPNIVIGLGGYGALSAGIIARHYRVPVVMLEANRIAGKVVKWLSKTSIAVYSNGRVTGIQQQKVKQLGIPIRSELMNTNLHTDIDNSIMTILIMGGSQGAHCINNAVCDAMPLLIQFRQQMRFIHLAGEQQLQKVAKAYRQHRLTAKVFSFCAHMGQLYRKSDLVICRAGGSSVAELTALELPSVLVPYQYAADGHQEANARVMQQEGAALMLRESELSGQSLAEIICRLLSNRRQLQVMAANAKRLSRPLAAVEIAHDILSLVNTRGRLVT